MSIVIYLVLFFSVLLSAVALIYSTVDVIRRSEREVRLKHALQFGGLAAIYIWTIAADVPGALTVITEHAGISASETVTPVIRTVSISLWIVYKTIFNVSRAPGLPPKRVKINRIVGAYLILLGLMALAIIMALFMYEVSRGAVPAHSLPGGALQFIAIGAASFALAYDTVQSILGHAYVRGFLSVGLCFLVFMVA